MHDIKKTTEPHSVVVLTGTINQDTIAKYLPKARKDIQGHLKLDGFRDGKVPDALIDGQVGEDLLKDRAAEIAIREILPETLVQQQLVPIITPSVAITPKADGGAEIEVRVAVYPVVTLPDYKKIAHDEMQTVEPVTVTEEDVTNALIHFKRERVRVEALDAGTPPDEAYKKGEEIAVADLPQLDDAFVAQIGFETVALFEENVRKNLLTSKEDHTKSERRAKILKDITDLTDADTPEPLAEYEIAKMESGLTEYLMQQGATLDAYLEHIKKTRADLHTEWHDESHARAKTQLALIEISKRENLIEDETELTSLVDSALERNKGADPVAVRSHFSVILRNEKVLRFLEQQ